MKFSRYWPFYDSNCLRIFFVSNRCFAMLLIDKFIVRCTVELPRNVSKYHHLWMTHTKQGFQNILVIGWPENAFKPHQRLLLFLNIQRAKRVQTIASLSLPIAPKFMNELLQIQKAYDCRDVWYARMHASIIVPNNRYTHFESKHTTNGLYKRHKQQRRFVRNQKRACVSSDTLKGALWIHCRTQSSNSTPSRVQLNEYAISRDRDRFAFTCSLHSPAHKKNTVWIRNEIVLLRTNNNQNPNNRNDWINRFRDLFWSKNRFQ